MNSGARAERAIFRRAAARERLLPLAIALLAFNCRSTKNESSLDRKDAALSAPVVEKKLRSELRGENFPRGVIALTWDDGPDVATLELAKYLRDENVSATFFVVGKWIDGVSSDPGFGKGVFATGFELLPVLPHLVRLGHRVANHTRNHVLLAGATREVVREQLRANQVFLDPALTDEIPLFRAPGGAWDLAAAAAVDETPELMRLVGPVRWDVDEKDWDASLHCRSSAPRVECERNGLGGGGPGGGMRVRPAIVAERYLAAIDAAARGIVLLHDRVGDVGSRYALELAKVLVPGLKRRGYVFAAPVLQFSPPRVRMLAKRELDGVLQSSPANNLVERARGWIDKSEREKNTAFRMDPCERSSVVLGDINGDQQADVCWRGPKGISCALAAGDRFLDSSVWLGAEGTARLGVCERTKLALFDINGDGRADLCGATGEGVVCGMAP